MKTDYHAYFNEYLHDGKVGVIDIGSNTVRLVVYDGVKRAPLALYSDKAFCGLGRGLEKTGKLHAEGKEQAEAALGRLVTMAELMDVVELRVIATAALRDAKDGQEFTARLERRFGLRIDVISGEQEAMLAAGGVKATIHNPEGLVCDLGGGSMELVALEKGEIAHQATLPIGPLRLADIAGGDLKRLRGHVRESLGALPWLKDGKRPALYAVGGSFRMLGRLHQRRANHPLRLLHNYAAPRKDMLDLLKELCGMTEKERAALPVPAKRAYALLPAALAMETLLEMSGAKEAVFSVGGIREGYLYGQLSPFLQKHDPLIASCAELAWQQGRAADYAGELFGWMAPLFPGESVAERRLRAGACILSELAWRVRPGARAEWAFDSVLSSLLIGLDHRERAALALALYNRHNCRSLPEDSALALVDEPRRLWAGMVGTAASLGYLLSGGRAGVLPKIRLKTDGSRAFSLKLPEELNDLAGDTVKKRLEGLREMARARAGPRGA